MKKELLLKHFALLLFFLVSHFSYSQLNVFTLNVTKTNESCSGNGTLTFNVTNPTPNAVFVYSVYLLPNTLNAIGVTSSNSITGLVAGNYRVVAVQSLGNLTNSQQQDIIITNTIRPLVYQVSGSPENCINGVITVTVTQGNPLTFEIISGPEIIAPQTSNIFTDLNVGQYVIRVNDICGDGIVQTYNLVGASSLTISPIQQTCGAATCSSSSANIGISTAVGSTIYYPVTITTTLIPPAPGTPQVQVGVINSGSTFPTPSGLLDLTLPLDNGVTYSYNIRATDACGNTFTYNGSGLVRAGRIELMALSETKKDLSSLSIDTCNLVPPFFVNFINAPAGFDPVAFNSQYPGPFTSSPVEFNSTELLTLPLGGYEVELTDACNTICRGQGVLLGCSPEISATPVCSTFGLVKLKKIDTVTITSAPATFPFPLPYVGTVVNNQFTIQVPLGTYTFEGIDACGNEYKLTRNIDLPVYQITADNEGGCENNTGSITIKYVNIGLELAFAAISIVSAPPTFLYPLPFNATSFISPSVEIKALITGLASGDYILNITDVCGNVYPLSITVPVFVSLAPPTMTFLRGCTDGLGSIFIDTPNRRFSEVIITAAPAAFPYPLPFNANAYLSSQGKFFMNELPEGNYSFSTTDVCGVFNNITGVVPGYQVIDSSVNVVENCGSFNLILNHVMDQPYAQSFWLQRWNAVTNVWEHPYSGVTYVDGTSPDITNSYQLYNFTTNYNIALYGKFRVVKMNYIFSNAGAALTNCPIVILHEFEFTGELKVLNATGVLCGDGSYNTFITVAGIPPFTFKITTKDGQPFLVDNSNSNYFSNLTSGIYNFQIEDRCGNVVNRVYDITTLLEPAISQDNLCDGQNGRLIAPSVSFLSYQWWHSSDPTVILSTTNTLNFTPFMSSTHAGNYFVRIYSNSSLSCLDKTISYTIPTVSNPQAGNDNTMVVCGSGSVNMFTLLTGSYDTSGSWQEITNSGMLTGANWNPMNLAFGTYRFRYLVNGFCDDTDEAIITVNLKQVPETPVISSGDVLCLGQPLELSVNPIFNANFEWTGPNGFLSQEQNPIIAEAAPENSGIYIVKAMIDGCESSSSIEVTGQPTPTYTTQNGCDGPIYRITVTPEEGSFDATTATYLWSGPNNFSSTLNPIEITGMAAGNYSVTVTNAEGCSLTKNVTVANTFCGAIALGISPNGDGRNEEFDLTGLGEDIRFKIFNRYGTMVFEQDDYTNQWHGQDYKGRQLPDATYYYYIKLKSGEEKTGWVYVTH